MECGLDRLMAVLCDRSVALISDDKDAGSGFDDVVGDGLELVDLEYADDLGTRRSRRRKLPQVMRSIAAMAWASVKSSGSRIGK